MSIIYGIDPGQERSAMVGWDGKKVVRPIENTNQSILDWIKATPDALIAIEHIRGYGLSAGNELFDTIFWSGRFFEAATLPPGLVCRKDILWHLCDNRKAGDREVRAALLDRIGPKGTKKEPGPMFGISGTHLFSALAVAVTWYDQNIN
jgi:hypothetical protein